MAVIVIQRGHVPRTTGATGAPGEQQYAIDTAALLALALQQMGHTPRVIDADVPDDFYRGDMFFALHWDGAPTPTSSGASVGYQTPEGNALAQRWKANYRNAGWTRAFMPDNYTDALRGYYGVRKAVAQGNRYAIITEAGFVTNSHDKAMMSPGLTAESILNTVYQQFPVASIEEDLEVFYVVLDEPPHNVALGGPGYWNHLDGNQHAAVLTQRGKPRPVDRATYDNLRAACLFGEVATKPASG